MPRRPIPSKTEQSISRAVSSGVPDRALAGYARWWQLETWLRLLVFLELMAARGSTWTDLLSERAIGRWTRDGINSYMGSVDADNPLTYLDSSELFELIDRDDIWDLFEPGLLPRVRWRGVTDEMNALRHRLAHCRRPHPDDLGRQEQTLRDLEVGARRVLETFNQQSRLWSAEEDDLTRGWIDHLHPDAIRLLSHAASNYSTEFELRSSRRPWDGKRSGRLWHAEWRTSDGYFNLRQFWENGELDEYRRFVVFVCQNFPTEVSISFSAADAPASLADAVGAIFDMLLSSRGRHPDDRFWATWDRGLNNLDYRLQVKSAISLATADSPFSIFSA